MVKLVFFIVWIIIRSSLFCFYDGKFSRVGAFVVCWVFDVEYTGGV